MVTNENQTRIVSTTSVEHGDEKSGPHFQETAQPQTTMAGLLAQVDREAERFRQTIAVLLTQIEVLHESGESKDAREDLVAQLREANQNLVIATFSAQDRLAEAESVSRRQEEFLSMLAHELRNPLAPISMTIELLGNITAAHPQLPKLHGIMNRQVNHLTHLVDDLVDASRISSGKIILKNRAVLLSEIIESAVETSQPFIDRRRHRLTIDLPVEPIVIDGDLVRLAQVFSNLLINAAKFTPEQGQIAMTASRSENAVTVSVRDNGSGIAPDMQPSIFELFTQGPCSLDRSQGGLGIGLALVRTLVEMHGGTVKVHSGGIGSGSEFTVSLPVSIEPLPYDSSPTSTAASARSCRILLIEDNADTNEILHALLTQGNHAVTSARDGASGFALAKENIYDVIVCDIGLPGMDGYEIVSQLRQGSLHSGPCFIAMTGYNQQENRARAFDAGFDHYLVKPVAIDILMNLISSSVL